MKESIYHMTNLNMILGFKLSQYFIGNEALS